MSVKYSWSRQNGAAVPPVRFMSIEPAEDYYKGMPLKLKEKGIVEPTDGNPEYICMAQYDPDAEIQPLEIPVQEVFPDVVYDRMNEDGTTEEVRFGSKGGGGVSSWNDLTDKPFYENAELLYSAENVEFPYDMDFTLILPKLLGIVPGETYDVIWDGKKYSCTAVSIDAEGVTVLLLGNKVQLGIDTGEPFMYTEIPDQGMAGIGDIASVMSGASESTYHSFSISSIKLKKLDPKFYDRPCYEEFTSFYSGTLTESVKAADGVYQYPVIKIVDGSPVGIDVPLTEGETVKITINGVTEEKVVKKRNNNYNQFYIGNEAFYVNSGETEDTGEGYCFMYDPELTPYTSVFTSSNKGYYSINLERNTITPLPVKFLPEDIYYVNTDNSPLTLMDENGNAIPFSQVQGRDLEILKSVILKDVAYDAYYKVTAVETSGEAMSIGFIDASTIIRNIIVGDGGR